MARDKTQKSSCWLKPHGGEKKETKSQKQREEIKATEEKKKKKKKGILTLMWVLKSELSHLMREASCPNFIGGAWSGAQLMRQKIWTLHYDLPKL